MAGKSPNAQVPLCAWVSIFSPSNLYQVSFKTLLTCGLKRKHTRSS